MTETQRSWLELEGACNVRDLGGLPARTGRTRHGVLVRSDALDALTAADVAVLIDLGVAHVVDLRTTSERAERGAGLLGTTSVTYSELEAFDDEVLARRRRARNEAFAAGVDPIRIMVDGYEQLLELAGPRFAEVLDRIVSPGGSPVLVHCSAGKDRTGVLVALLLEVAGVEREAIVADYGATQQRMGGIVARLHDSEAYQHVAHEMPAFVLEAHPETMERLLVRLDSQWGGAAAYFLAHGVSAGTLDRWRELLVGE
jgi:protein tyrosine/serine phosphatase